MIIPIKQIRPLKVKPRKTVREMVEGILGIGNTHEWTSFIPRRPVFQKWIGIIYAGVDVIWAEKMWVHRKSEWRTGENESVGHQVNGRSQMQPGDTRSCQSSASN